MNTSDRQLLLRTYPVLAGVPPDLLGRLEVAEPAAVGEGLEVFGEGVLATCCPLLLEGRIRVSRLGDDGEEVLLYRVSPGEICAVAALALLGGTAHAATGIAETRVRFAGISRAIFTELLLASPRFRASVFEGLGGRMGQVAALVHDLVFRRVDERLASQLLAHPRPIVATHQMLACEIGSSREVVPQPARATRQTPRRLPNECGPARGRTACRVASRGAGRSAHNAGPTAGRAGLGRLNFVAQRRKTGRACTSQPTLPRLAARSSRRRCAPQACSRS